MPLYRNGYATKGAYEHRIFLDSADDSVVLRLQGSIRFDPILSGVDLLLSQRELTIRRKRIGTIISASHSASTPVSLPLALSESELQLVPIRRSLR